MGRDEDVADDTDVNVHHFIDVDEYDDDAFWAESARRLYEHLKPGQSWYEFPADQRDEWIRALRGD